MMYRFILKIGLIVLIIAAFSAPRAHGATRHHHHHACRWHLAVTGGQTPGSAIVLHLTNSCVNNGGPQVTKRVGVI